MRLAVPFWQQSKLENHANNSHHFPFNRQICWKGSHQMISASSVSMTMVIGWEVKVARVAYCPNSGQVAVLKVPMTMMIQDARW